MNLEDLLYDMDEMPPDLMDEPEEEKAAVPLLVLKEKLSELVNMVDRLLFESML